MQGRDIIAFGVSVRIYVPYNSAPVENLIAMITRSDVFNQIKQMYKGVLPAQHYILFEELAARMSLCKEPLLVMLEDLEGLGVIAIKKVREISVTLTGYGLTQEVISAE